FIALVREQDLGVGTRSEERLAQALFGGDHVGRHPLELREIANHLENDRQGALGGALDAGRRSDHLFFSFFVCSFFPMSNPGTFSLFSELATNTARRRSRVASCFALVIQKVASRRYDGGADVQ